MRDPHVDRRLVVARTGLSQANLQALFVRDLGVPIRTYQLWRRLLVALAAFAHLDATNTAHFAGFADLAHVPPHARPFPHRAEQRTPPIVGVRCGS